jgi:hypothetical protein
VKYNFVFQKPKTTDEMGQDFGGLFGLEDPNKLL